MSIRRLPLIAAVLAAVAAPAFAQNFTSPDRSSSDYDLRDPDRAPRGGAETSLWLSGTVTQVDRDRESIRLRTSRGLQTVELYDGTRLVDDAGHGLSLRDLRVGDHLQINGAERDGRIVADRVTLLRPGVSRYSEVYRETGPVTTDRAVITGTVRTPTYDVSRKVKVHTADGDITVVADPDTPITAYYGAHLSIHELEQGDRVRVVGEWDSSDRLRADRIEVLPPPRQATLGYRESLGRPVVTVIGQLVSYDKNRDRMRLRTRDGDRIIIAKGVAAYLRGQRIDRGDMRQGDRVRATGYWDGRELIAARVELAY